MSISKLTDVSDTDEVTAAKVEADGNDNVTPVELPGTKRGFESA